MKARVDPGYTEPSHQLLWRINEACNLSCPYCFREGIDRSGGARPANAGHFEERVALALERTGYRWRIHLTGGEPFLHPGFVDLARSLTNRNVISLNTNLTAGDVAGFSRSVDPRAVHSVNASYHLYGFPPGADLTERFLENLIVLQVAGFAVRVMLITWPPALERMTQDIAMLAARGAKVFYVKIFRGTFGGRSYPAAYSTEQRRLIESFGLTKKECAILNGRHHFRNRRCKTGFSALDMDPDGNLNRCSTLREPRGNLLEDVCLLDERPVRCPAEECACPYQGLKFAAIRPRTGPAEFFRRAFRRSEN